VAANQNPLGIHPVHGDEPLSPLAGDLSNKRKGHERNTLDKKRDKTNNNTLNRDETVQFLLNKQCPPPTHDYYYSYTGRYYPNPRAPLASSEGGGAPGAPTTATTIVYSPSRPHAAQRPPPSEVRVLMLSWTPPQSSAGGSTAGPDGGGGGSLGVLLEPDADREALRARLKARGYRVQCRAVPADDYPTTTVETILDRFLEQSTPDTLLVIYYRGFGCLDKEGRMLFSRYVELQRLMNEMARGTLLNASDAATADPNLAQAPSSGTTCAIPSCRCQETCSSCLTAPGVPTHPRNSSRCGSKRAWRRRRPRSNSSGYASRTTIPRAKAMLAMSAPATLRGVCPGRSTESSTSPSYRCTGSVR
jgi:hypothetical protein